MQNTPMTPSGVLPAGAGAEALHPAPEISPADRRRAWLYALADLAGLLVLLGLLALAWWAGAGSTANLAY